ncbi:MAG TPA: CHAT domain-containing protein [Candidatus Solibacter sp.]|nr:CHAT domain-containing protein [Candidatus Solibacter sp.]
MCSIMQRVVDPLVSPRRDRMSSSAFCVFIALLMLQLACEKPHDPQSVLVHVYATLNQGDTDSALLEARHGYEAFHSRSTTWSWKFTIAQAEVLNRQGKPEEVLKLLADEPGPVPAGNVSIKKLWLEGLAYTSLHMFADADRRLQEAGPLCENGDPSICADVATARGTLEMQRGRFADAQHFFERVLETARTDGNPLPIANALLDLSWCAEEQSHFDEALDLAGEAHSIASKQNFGNVALKSLGNMGWAYYKLGEPEKAESMFSEAGAQAEKSRIIPDQALWLQAAGYVHLDERDFAVAEDLYGQSLKLSRQINNREHIINSLIALAFVSEQTSKLDDAQRYAAEALKMSVEDGNKRDQTYPKLVQGRIAAQQHDAVTAQTALEEVVDSPDATVSLKWEAQRSLARLYEDERQYEGARREYRAALTTFEGARDELKHDDSRLPFLNNASRIYDDYVHFLVKQGKSDEALEAAEYSRARTLNEGLGLLRNAVLKNAALKTAASKKDALKKGMTPKATLKKSAAFEPDPLNAAHIARQSGGTIFFYWLGEKESYLWLIAPKKTTLFTLPPESEIESTVQRYRKALTGPNDPIAEQNRDGQALYKMLIEPAKALLPKEKNTKIFIVPDASLNTLNFETLIAPDPTPHYWIEDATITNASSLRLLASSRRIDAKPSLLLLGDAVVASPDYPELRKASTEMETIQKHFATAQQRVFARDKATPPAYLNGNPETFSYIHFVAHGTASRISPLDSAIVLSKSALSKGGAEDDSFKLYARDIIHRPLHADLVTISTCYGAGSRAYSGEGLVGLSWAFLRAGAHNVIGALWEVSDVSTPQLMDDLYGGLSKGQAPSAALRAAKLSLLHSGGAFHRPFYWAPFQLYTGS